MGAAVGIAASLAAPIVSNVLGSVVQNLAGGGGGAAGPGGLFGLLGPAFGKLLGGSPAGQIVQGLMGQNPLPFSPGQISPQTFNNPVSYLGDASRVLDNVRDHRMGDVRDHRTGNVRDHRTGRPLVLPPPPPRPGSSPGSGGGIRELQADVEQAKQAFLANPQDIEAMIAYQDAQQKLQLAAKLVSEESSMYASIENSIIQKTRVS